MDTEVLSEKIKNIKEKIKEKLGVESEFLGAFAVYSKTGTNKRKVVCQQCGWEYHYEFTNQDDELANLSLDASIEVDKHKCQAKAIYG